MAGYPENLKTRSVCPTYTNWWIRLLSGGICSFKDIVTVACFLKTATSHTDYRSIWYTLSLNSKYLRKGRSEKEKYLGPTPLPKPIH